MTFKQQIHQPSTHIFNSDTQAIFYSKYVTISVVKLAPCFFLLVCFVFVLFCFVLFCFVLFCFVLFCFVLFCFVLFCFVFVLSFLLLLAESDVPFQNVVLKYLQSYPHPNPPTCICKSGYLPTANRYTPPPNTARFSTNSELYANSELVELEADPGP